MLDKCKWIGCGAVLLLAAVLAGCGKPAYPDEQSVRERFQVEYRTAECQLIRIDAPKPQPDQASLPFLYLYIRYEASCKTLDGTMRTLLRQQVWQLNRERPALFQDAWRWTPAGEISG